MENLTNAIRDGIKNRRTIHTLSPESTISDSRLQELIGEVITHTPSPFNTQTCRIVLLLKEEHYKLWDLAYRVVSSAVSPEIFEKSYKPRIALFRASYGTGLFYEDLAPVKPLEEKWPMLKKKFPQWSEHSNAMHQFAAWILLEAEGLGCSLQHYNPMIDAAVSETWNIPRDWSLKAQLVFGKPAGPPHEKTFEPLNQRLFVYGA